MYRVSEPDGRYFRQLSDDHRRPRRILWEWPSDSQRSTAPSCAWRARARTCTSRGARRSACRPASRSRRWRGCAATSPGAWSACRASAAGWRGRRRGWGSRSGWRTRTSTWPATCCRWGRSGSSWTTSASSCSATACCRRRSIAVGRCGRSAWRRASPTAAAGSWPRSTTRWWTGGRPWRSRSCCSTSSRTGSRSYRCRGRRRPRRERRGWRRGPSRWGPRSPCARRAAPHAWRGSRARAASRLAGTLRRAALAAGEEVLRPAPASALNARIGPRRTLVRHSVELDAVRRVKRAADATVNDVCLAAGRRRPARAGRAAAR